MRKLLFGVALAAGAALGCTKPNPAVCCVSAADCEAAGFPEIRSCQPGLVCELNQCIEPTCSAPSDCTDPSLSQCVDGICRGCDPSGNIGCSADEPRCDAASTTCTGCSADDDCATYVDTPRCGSDGACVECIDSAQCGGTSPVCDAGACRGCEVDSDCASNVCSSDGSCVAVEDTIFISTDGVDSGSCTKDQPCATVAFAASKLTATRLHIVLAPGSYTNALGGADFINKSAHIHANGARVTTQLQNAPDPLNFLRVSGGTLRVTGMTLEQTLGTNAVGFRCEIGSTLVLDGVRAVTGYKIVSADGCDVTLEGSSFRRVGGADALDVRTGSLTMSRSHIDRSTAFLSTQLLVTNSLFTEVGLDLEFSRGTVAFSTFYNNNYPGAAMTCGSRDPQRPQLLNSILWSPNGATMVVSGCRANDSLVGPVGTGCDAGCGNFNADPQFVDLNAGNLHLRPTSPARDRALSGPAVDFEGDARPSGSGWDLGYDEVP